jgi:hypothetical protein
MPDRLETRASKLAILQEKRVLIDRLVEYLQAPDRVAAPLDQDIRALFRDIDEVAFVDGWGGG